MKRMIQRQKDFKITPQQYLKMVGFFNIAYKDYLASRTLFINDQLYRAIILANTSIEKYFKVYLLMQGKTVKTHNVKKLFRHCLNFDPSLKDKINIEFVELLTKAYHMRYFDDDIFSNETNEFHLCVCKNKTLAELDETIYFIEHSWILRKNQEIIERRFMSDLKKREPHLSESNFLISGPSKKEFIEGEDLVYEIRNSKQKGVVEIIYVTDEMKDDGKFI
jgi:HEPN domain-containing protein